MTTLYSNILEFFNALGISKASGMAYMYSEPRYSLTNKQNNCVIAGIKGIPRDDDAGNWTGCAPGAGQKVGTCLDWSACAESQYLGRAATPEDLDNLNFNKVAGRMTAIFNQLGLNQLSDQDVANITMHVAMHFGIGNLRVVQNALRDLGEDITPDGQMGPQTLAALKRQTNKNAANTYNAIRARLEESYNNAPAHVRAGFLNGLKHFPEKKETNYKLWLLIALIVVLLIALLVLWVF